MLTAARGGAVPHDPRHPAAEDPAVADAPHLQPFPRPDAAVVVGDGPFDLRAHVAVAGSVVPRQRVLPDLDLREGALELPQQRHGVGGVVEHGVPVGVDAEVVGGDLADAADGLSHVPPGPRLDLDAVVPQPDRGLRLDGVLLGRHVVVPEGDRRPVPALAAEQPVEGHPGQLARGVEQRHLQAGSQRVVPHGLERGAAHHLLFRLHPPPSVVLHRLPPAADPGVGVDAGDLELRPGVNAGALHLAAHPVDEGDHQGEPLKAGYFRRHRICPVFSTGWAGSAVRCAGFIRRGTESRGMGAASSGHADAVPEHPGRSPGRKGACEGGAARRKRETVRHAPITCAPTGPA